MCRRPSVIIRRQIHRLRCLLFSEVEAVSSWPTLLSSVRALSAAMDLLYRAPARATEDGFCYWNMERAL